MSYGGGIFDSAQNYQGNSSLEQTIAAVSTMDTWDNHASTGFAGGTGTSTNPYRIETAPQFAYFMKQIKANNKYSGKYVSLTKSIDLSQYRWTNDGSFSGYFNGNMCTIKGLTAFNCGLFYYAYNISNLILDNATIYCDGSDGQVGALIHFGGDNTTNCIVSNLTALSSDPNENISPFIQQVSRATLTNCLIIDSIFQQVYLYDPFIFDCDGGGYYNYSYNNCALIRCKLPTTPKQYLILNDKSPNGVYIDLTYPNGTSLTRIKRLYGSSSTWGGWFYDANLNGGYPLPKELIKVSSSSTQTSTQVYNYLVSLGFSTT